MESPEINSAIGTPFWSPIPHKIGIQPFFVIFFGHRFGSDFWRLSVPLFDDFGRVCDSILDFFRNSFWIKVEMEKVCFDCASAVGSHVALSGHIFRFLCFSCFFSEFSGRFPAPVLSATK